MQKKRIFLGIDIGLANLGFSIINNNNLVSFGVVITKKEEIYNKRLEIIYKKISKIIDFYKPDLIIIENIFHGRNNKTFISISNVQGVLFLLTSQKKYRVY